MTELEQYMNTTAILIKQAEKLKENLPWADHD